jgi:hypothetical protein
MENKPNLFFIGLGKTGSTALYRSFQEHPNIFVPDQKELHYFAKDLNRKREKILTEKRMKFFNPSWEACIDHFESSSNQMYRADMSPDYYYSEVSPQAIEEFNPEAKIIVGLRHPIRWIQSAHLELLSNGYETLEDINKAIERESYRKERVTSANGKREASVLYYQDHIRYADHFERWYELFDEDQIFVYLYEHLRDNPKSVLLNLTKFLGLTRNLEPIERDINPTTEPSSLFFLKQLKDSYIGSLVGNALPRNVKQKTGQLIDSMSLTKGEKKKLSPVKRKEIIEYFKKTQAERLSRYTKKDITLTWKL